MLIKNTKILTYSCYRDALDYSLADYWFIHNGHLDAKLGYYDPWYHRAPELHKVSGC